MSVVAGVLAKEKERAALQFVPPEYPQVGIVYDMAVVPTW